jgi:uncharacterized membrane protein
MHSKTAVLVATAALLFAAGAGADTHEQGSEAEKIKCEGVNACKGQSACHTAHNGCAGKNSCKGKGFLMMTPEECEQAKGAAQPKDERQG